MMDEQRSSKEKLDDVCIDCNDFLNHACVECEDCPVKRLKDRQAKYEKGYLSQNKKSGAEHETEKV